MQCFIVMETLRELDTLMFLNFIDYQKGVEYKIKALKAISQNHFSFCKFLVDMFMFVSLLLVV